MNDFNIHEGEAEAIVLYIETNADLLGTDDYKTIKVCKIFSIIYFTTLIFIYRCFINKKLSKNDVLLKLDKLLNIGWYKEDLVLDYKNKILNLEE